MNLLEAYEAVKNGKIVRIPDCDNLNLYFAFISVPFLPIKMFMRIFSVYQNRPETFDDLRWDECSDIKVPIKYVGGDFIQVTAEEMLKEIQEQWDRSNKKPEAVMLTSYPIYPMKGDL